MPQRIHDAGISIAHRREVAARTNIGHRKLRPRRFLQNRSENDERPWVVQLAVRGIGDDADHLDVATLGSGHVNVLADDIACREQRASEGRRDQRHGGLARAVVPREVATLETREFEEIEEARRHVIGEHR
jgi:hypothetical protein